MIQRTHLQAGTPSLYGATLQATACRQWAAPEKVTDRVQRVTCSECQALEKRRKRIMAAREREIAA